MLFSTVYAVSPPFEAATMPTGQSCSGNLVEEDDCQGVSTISSSDDVRSFLACDNQSYAHMLVEFVNNSIEGWHSFNGSAQIIFEVDSSSSFCTVEVWNGSWSVPLDSLCNQTGTFSLDVSDAIKNESQFENLKVNITAWGNSSSEEKWKLDMVYANCSKIDDMGPFIRFEEPTPPNGLSSNISSALINVSFSEPNGENGTLRLNWNGEWINESGYWGESWHSFNKTGLMSGTYTYYVWINDSYGNYNQTPSRTVSVQLNPWWSTEWTARKSLEITNNEDFDLSSEDSVKWIFDTSEYVDCGRLKEDCEDLRIIYQVGYSMDEIEWYNSTPCNTSNTNIWFKLQEPLPNTSSDSNYYLYYSNPNANAPDYDYVYSKYFSLITSNESEFDQGDYNRTFYNESGFVQLNTSSSTSGNYISRIFDAEGMADWSSISWWGTAWGELPNYGQSESIPNGANMSGNVLLLHMNEVSGSIIDYSGSGYNGTVSGATYGASGKFNTAMSFDGNDYISHGNILSPGNKNWTMCLWFKWNGATSDRILYNKENLYEARVNGGYVNFAWQPSWAWYGGTTFPVSQNVWYHTCVKYDHYGQYMYKNGIQVFWRSQSGDIGSISNPLCIGARSAACTQTPFAGSIDEFAVFNYSLSDAEILKLYKRGVLQHNITVKTCDDSGCADDDWGQTFTASPQNLTVPESKYLQYKSDFYTENSNHTPELYNITVEGELTDFDTAFALGNEETAPVTCITYPLDWEFYGTTDMNLEFTAEIDIDHCWYEYDGANTTIENCTSPESVGFTALEDQSTLVLYVNNTVGSLFEDNVTFTVDLDAPKCDMLNVSPLNPAENESVVCYSGWTDNYNISNGVVGENGTGSFTNHSVGVNDSWINYTIDSDNLNAGSVVCEFYSYDLVGNENSTQLTFEVADVTNPVINSFNHSPSGSDELDPGIAVNVSANVTDNLAVDSVLLQVWNGSWSDYEMDESGGLYHGSFVPSSGNYTYRIWANDSASNFNFSSNATLEIDYDWTWNINESNFTKAAPYNTNTNVTYFLVNNTGDYDLLFNLSYTSSIDVTLSNDSFSLCGGCCQEIAANATTPATAASYDIDILANAVNSSASPDSLTLSGSLQSYPGGPFLYVTIPEYDSTTYPGQVIEVNAKVKNIGNETAENAWLFMDLPSGWSTTYSQNASVGNLSQNQIGWNNISDVFISSSQPSGTYTVNATTGFENYSSNQVSASSVEITVISTEPGVTTTTLYEGGGGGSGSGGGASDEQKEKLFQTEETYELVRGREQDFLLRVENPFSGDLENVTVSISGFLAQYLKISPETVQRIPANKSYDFKIHIQAPKYFNQGIYDLKFTINGLIKETVISGNVTTSMMTRMKESRDVKLFVLEIPREEASYYMEDGEGMVESMTEAGLNTAELAFMLDKMRNNYEKLDFDSVKSLYESIKEQKEKALSAVSIISEVEGDIGNAVYNGLKVPRTERLVMLAKAALDRGDYNTALERANDAKMTYGLETVGKFNVIAFIVNKKEEVSLASVGIIALAYFALLVVRYNIVTRKLKSLSEEEKILFGLIKEIQRDCFERGKLSMNEYHDSLMQYENRLSTIIQDVIKYEAAKSMMLRPFKSERVKLNDERKKILNLIKRTQKDYLQSKKLETHVYESRMKSYTERLTEIEEKLADVETKNLGKGRGWLAGAAVLLVMLSPLALCASQESMETEKALNASQGWMLELVEAGLPTNRYNDTLENARQLYEAQVALEKSGGKADFSMINDAVEELSELRHDSYKTYDELKALEMMINQTEGIDKAPVMKIYEEAKTEFESERYENSLELVNQAYEKMSELEAMDTKVKAFYEASSKSVMEFLRANWKEILISVTVSLVSLLIAYKKITIWRLERKIKYLEKRKNSITNLIAESQRDYFEKGKLNESTYHIRIKKYSEFIRDINRQIPLIKEELKIRKEKTGRYRKIEKE